MLQVFADFKDNTTHNIYFTIRKNTLNNFSLIIILIGNKLKKDTRGLSHKANYSHLTANVIYGPSFANVHF